MAFRLLLAVLMAGVLLDRAEAGQYPRLDKELRSAAEDGDIDVVRGLIARGADINAVVPHYQNTPLYNAAKNGHAAIVRLLLENRADTNAKNKWGQTALMAACSSEKVDIDILKALLNGGADVNAADIYGSTALMDATRIAKGNLDALRILLDHGANANLRDKFGSSALTLAKGTAEAGLLLDRGADINAKGADGYTPLMEAFYYPGKVKLLIDRGARTDDTLYNAVWAGDRDMVKRLLAKGADVNAHLPKGETPLMFAARAGDAVIVEELLARGASAAARKNDTSETALFWAANGPVAEALIKRGAEIEAKSAEGWTPIFAASADKTEVLLAHGAKLDVVAKDGCTVFAAAALRNLTDTAKVLLKRNVDVDKAYESTTSRYSALLWAASHDNSDIVRLILERGVSETSFKHAFATCKDAGVARILLEHWPATIKKSEFLAKAASDGNIELAKALLESGIDIDDAAEYGETALYKAAYNGRTEMVEFLLKHGANMDKADSNGDGPLQIAAQRGKVGALKVLLEQDVRPEAKDRALAKAAYDNRLGAAKLLIENGANPNPDGWRPSLPMAAYKGNAELVEILMTASPNPVLPPNAICSDYDKTDSPPCPKERILDALTHGRSNSAAAPKTDFTAGDQGLDFWVPEKEKPRLAAGKLVWGAKSQPKPPSGLVSESNTVWRNLSDFASKLISDDIERFVGQAKPAAPTLVQDQYESRSQFEAKVAAAKSKYTDDLRAYREKVASYPVWRRNALLEASLNSVLGTPGVAAKRHYDADSQTFAPEVLSESGFKQAFVLTQTIPNEKAADFDKALQGAKLKVFFQLQGAGVSATAAEFNVLGTAYEALPAQGGVADAQKLARVDLGGLEKTVTAGPEALSVNYADNPELAKKVAELENLKRKRSQKNELQTLEAQIAQLKKGEEKAFHSDVDAPAFAPKPGHPHDLALVVGIESYQDQNLPKADFAERDAQSVAGYLAALGVPKENIKLLKGEAATAGKIKGYLGSWLAKNVKPDSRVFFYFSGHGAPEPESRDAYLVSWDGDPQFLKTTAVSLTSVYEDLGKLKAKQVLVAMDSCFSGTGGRSVIKKGSRPLVNLQEAQAPSQITVLAAAGKDEIAGSFDEQGHGTFTYYLLKGLEAGSHDSRSLFDYLKPKVQDKAARSNATQVPVYQGPDFAF